MNGVRFVLCVLSISTSFFLFRLNYNISFFIFLSFVFSSNICNTRFRVSYSPLRSIKCVYVSLVPSRLGFYFFRCSEMWYVHTHEFGWVSFYYWKLLIFFVVVVFIQCFYCFINFRRSLFFSGLTVGRPAVWLWKLNTLWLWAYACNILSIYRILNIELYIILWLFRYARRTSIWTFAWRKLFKCIAKLFLYFMDSHHVIYCNYQFRNVWNYFFVLFFTQLENY